MEINEIDVRKMLIKDYITADEISILPVEDYFVVLTGKMKSETVIYGEKPIEELYTQVIMAGSNRQTWLKLTNPIMKELGSKISYLSTSWAGHSLKLKLDKWNGREVVRVDVMKRK